MKRIIVNGMRYEVPDDADLEYIKKMAAEPQRDDMVCLEGADGTLVQVRLGDKIPDGAKIVRIPEVVKGTSPRILSEIELLSRHVHGRGRTVKSGLKTVDGKPYIAVVVKDFPLNRSKYRQWKTDILFMLPPDYPRLPALGCYVKFPPETTGEIDHHATLRAYYNAPELQEEGWYWYCVGLGKKFASYGFAHKDIHKAWQPGPRPEEGHNLVTLYAIADRGINTP